MSVFLCYWLEIVLHFVRSWDKNRIVENIRLVFRKYRGFIITISLKASSFGAIEQLWSNCIETVMITI